MANRQEYLEQALENRRVEVELLHEQASAFHAQLTNLRAENELLREDKLKRDDMVEQVRSMHAENERLKAEVEKFREQERRDAREFAAASVADPETTVRLEVYEAAVKGRQEFRSALREARAEIATLKRANDEHFEGSKTVLRANRELMAQLLNIRALIQNGEYISAIRTIDVARSDQQQTEAQPVPTCPTCKTSDDQRFCALCQRYQAQPVREERKL